MARKIWFLAGLGFFLAGQIILAQGNDFVYHQRPIDFAHWSLLCGAVLLIPQVVSFPKSILSYVGIPLTLTGIACTIGMCVLDFIWWSFPDEAMRMAFTQHISQVPSIWIPFVAVGPSSKVFNLGLLVLALNFFERGKTGVLLIVVADLILWNIIPLPLRLVLGYALTLVGFGMVFLKQEQRQLR